MGGVVEDGPGLGVTRGSADDRRDEGAENAGADVTETRASPGLARSQPLASDADAAPLGGPLGLERTLASGSTSGDAAADHGRRRGADELDRTRARPREAAASAADSLDELDLDRTRASMSSSRGPAGPFLAAATLASASSSGMGPSELADTTAQVERAPTLDLRRGAAALGRYVLLEELGAGGMGVVYAAYDPELDRKIALKVVQAVAGIPAAAVGGLSWLMREAQAMARLSHPNVVQIYDVGVLGERLFIAMELVDGGTLGGWLEGQEAAGARASWRVVVDRFVAAGRGLAAAHAAGLIHRDFKPENVLIGRDGRPRVTDFGLARAAAEAEGAATIDVDPQAPTRSISSVLASNLTQAGAMLGTPAYMAPEQFAGAAVDARCDQFAFCVALYEALYAERPFVGETLDELRRAVLSGTIREARAGHRVPPWLRRVLLRGLARDPDARFPTIDALLAQLARDPGRMRRRLIAGAGIVALVGVAIGGWWGSGAREEAACTGGEAKVAAVWGGARKAALERAFTGSGAAAAAETWAAVEQLVDADLAAWSTMHREACEATRRGEQSAALLDLRMRCLGGHLRELDALAEVFVAGDREVIDRGVTAVAELPSLRRCADADALLKQLAPPSDPKTAAAAEALRERLIDAEARARGGRVDDARAAAQRIVDDAEALGWAPIVAEANLALGRCDALAERYAEAREALIAALTHGRAASHDEVVRDAAIELVAAVGDGLTQADEGELWARLAAADLERLPTPAARARFLRNRSRLRWTQARYADAETDARDYLERVLDLYGETHPTTAQARIDLARSMWTQGDERRPQARELIARGRRDLEALVGRDHPLIARALRQEGNLDWIDGKLEAALTKYKRGLAIAEANGRDAEASRLLLNIGSTFGRMGQLDEAREFYARALALAEGRDEVDPADVLPILENLVATEFGLLSRVLAGKPATDISIAADEAAILARIEALEPRIAAMQAATFGEEHPEFARVHILRGAIAAARGAPTAAIKEYERAIALRLKTPEVHPILLARARAALAENLVAATPRSPQARARAVKEAAEAAALFRSEGDYGAAELADLEAWRREVGLVDADPTTATP